MTDRGDKPLEHSQEAARRLEAMFEACPDGLLVFGADERLLVASPSVSSMYGGDRLHVAIGRSFEEMTREALREGVFTVEDQEPERWLAEQLDKRRRREPSVSRVKTRDGRWIQRVDRPMSTGEYLGVRMDVTDLVEGAKALERAQSESAAAVQRLWSAVEAFPDPVVLYDADDVLIACNSAFREFFGARANDIRAGIRFRDIMRIGHDLGVYPDSEGRFEEWVVERAERQRNPEGPWLLRYAGGGFLRVHDVVTETGDVLGVRVDVTDDRRKEAALAEARREADFAKHRLWSAIEAIPEGFALFDAEDLLVVCNEQFKRQYVDIADLIEPGASFEALVRAGVDRGMAPEAAGREEAWIAERMAEHRNPSRVFEQELPGDRHIQIRETRTKIGDTVGFRTDVTELRRQTKRAEQYARQLETARAEMADQARRDPLTGLANRRHLEERLAALADAPGSEGGSWALMNVDLDRFKEVNDTLGHGAGDELLCHVAAALRGAVRARDLVARIGGDEFVILCAAASSEADVLATAERIVARLKAPFGLSQQPVRIGGSVGVAFSRDPSCLLVDSDLALYEAKRSGRGRVVAYTPALRRVVEETRALAGEIKLGVERGEFTPYFQPQFRADTLHCAGLEALVRWRHPERGVLRPADFLPAAEELDLVAAIDRMVLEQTIGWERRWRARGLAIPRLSVNVSGARLRDPALIKALERIDPRPGLLSVELLESIFLDETDAEVDWALDRLREIGVGVELDDFGAGYTSIVGLLNIKPDRLKIDRKLVMGVVDDAKCRTVVKSLIDIGGSLDIEVVGEGVETLEQRRLLERWGCDVLQGFGLAGPMGPEDIEIRLARGSLLDLDATAVVA